MSWHPIVVGVDTSPQAVTAAAFGWRLAQAADAEFYLAHGVRPIFQSPPAAELPSDVDLLFDRYLEAERANVAANLKQVLPADITPRVEARLGRGAAVVAEVAHERDAGLIVLGGKHHSTLGRWMGGSTAHHLVRVTDIPLLVTGPRVRTVRRIVVGADLSHAVRPAFETALRFARLFGAQLRIVHAVEPLPVFAEMPQVLDEAAFYEDSKQQFDRCLEPLLETAVASHVIRKGYAADALALEVAQWEADLVVVGSHGKGWMDRLLIGSTTERLLNQLPTSLLVVPVAAATGEKYSDRPGPLAKRAARPHGTRDGRPVGTTLV